jgi:hypothetical protein
MRRNRRPIWQNRVAEKRAARVAARVAISSPLSLASLKLLAPHGVLPACRIDQKALQHLAHHYANVTPCTGPFW